MKRETAKLFLDHFTDEQLDDAGLITDREVLQHYVDGWEVEMLYGKNTYHVDSDPSFSKFHRWRKAKCLEIEFMGVKVRIKPPMTEAPEHGTRYWVIDFSEDYGHDYFEWTGDGVDHLCLKRGQCLWSEEDAKTVVKALGWEDER